MFLNPEVTQFVEKFGNRYWSAASPEAKKTTFELIRRGVEIFEIYYKEVTDLALEVLKEERPKASNSFIKRNAPKIAQEQLRVVISTIFPTGLVYTVDTITLYSMLQASGWNKPLRDLLTQMRDLVIYAHPEMDFLRSGKGLSEYKDAYKPSMDSHLSEGELSSTPEVIDGKIIYLDGPESVMDVANSSYMNLLHKDLDLLHFHPLSMASKNILFVSKVTVSIMTLGQDQRHRTIHRTPAVFDGSFYTPPLVTLVPRLGNDCRELFQMWMSLFSLSPELAYMVAPYGVRVNYRKTGTAPAIFHEMSKRRCFSAQEEIHHLGHLSNRAWFGDDTLRYFKPSCESIRLCQEKDRFCGRDLINLMTTRRIV